MSKLSKFAGQRNYVHSRIIGIRGLVNQVLLRAGKPYLSENELNVIGDIEGALKKLGENKDKEWTMLKEKIDG